MSRRRVSRAKLVAGAAVHLVAPAYALALVGDAALGHAPATLAGWLPHALALGGPFLLAYGAAALGLTGLAALADRAAPAPPVDPAQESRDALAGALAAARGHLGAEGEALLTKLAALPSDHADPAVRAITRDIVRLLEAGHGAPAATTPALTTLAAALEQASQAAADEAQDRALTVAHYVKLKYGQEID